MRPLVCYIVFYVWNGGGIKVPYTFWVSTNSQDLDFISGSLRFGSVSNGIVVHIYRLFILNIIEKLIAITSCGLCGIYWKILIPKFTQMKMAILKKFLQKAYTEGTSWTETQFADLKNPGSLIRNHWNNMK